MMILDTLDLLYLFIGPGILCVLAETTRGPEVAHDQEGRLECHHSQLNQIRYVNC